MPILAIPKTSGNIATYAVLKKQVRETLFQAQERIEQEKARAYWQVGKLINEHVESHKNPSGERAKYGDQVVANLARDLGMGEKVLYQAMEFAAKYKNFSARRNSPENELSWTHYKALLPIPDETDRLQLADQAEKMKWSSRELEREVEKVQERRYRETFRSRRKKKTKFLKPLRGILYTYQIAESKNFRTRKSKLVLDLGFRIYRDLAPEVANRFQTGSLVEPGPGFNSTQSTDFIQASKKKASALFTYRALVEKVVDGDTLRVIIDLGFGNITEQYLRLRGIDTPEMKTKKGKKAYQFVKRELAQSPVIILQSSRSDKYDRYLADVFYTVNGVEYYLNNRLLETGLAKKMDF